MRRSVRFGAVLLVLVLAACGGARTIPATNLDKLVLQQADVGPVFAAFNSGAQAQLDNQGTGRSDPSRYGREGGWIARFHRPGSAATKGALVVESRIDLFRSGDGAKKDLRAYRALFAAAPGSHLRPLQPSGLGDEATGVTFVQVGGATIRFFRIAWRYRNATASVTVEGFDQKISVNDATALARKQQARLTHA